MFDNDNTYKLKFVFNNSKEDENLGKLKYVVPLEDGKIEIKNNKIEFFRQSSGRIIMPVTGKIFDIYKSGTNKCVQIEISKGLYIVLSGKLTVGIKVGDEIPIGTFIGVLESYSLDMQVIRNGNVLSAVQIGELL